MRKLAMWLLKRCVPALRSDSLLLHDMVSTRNGTGIITSIYHGYEGMPYEVSFPCGRADFFEARDLVLLSRPVFIPMV